MVTEFKPSPMEMFTREIICMENPMVMAIIFGRTELLIRAISSMD